LILDLRLSQTSASLAIPLFPRGSLNLGSQSSTPRSFIVVEVFLPKTPVRASLFQPSPLAFFPHRTLAKRLVASYWPVPSYSKHPRGSLNRGLPCLVPLCFDFPSRQRARRNLALYNLALLPPNLFMMIQPPISITSALPNTNLKKGSAARFLNVFRRSLIRLDVLRTSGLQDPPGSSRPTP